MAEFRAGTRRAWLELDVAALGRNAAALAERLGTARLLPIVKADGYGLGALRAVRALRAADPWGFGVATVDEGAILRTAGVSERIIVFFPLPPADTPSLARHGLEPAVSSVGALLAYGAHAEAAGPSRGILSFHLEVDTGMARAGLPASEVDRWAPRVASLLEAGGLRLASTFTHFHSAEVDPEATRAQWELFRAALARMRVEGLDPGLIHVANSAAILLHPRMEADLARPGLYLYGGGPGSPGSSLNLPEGVRPPEPVARLRARVLGVREVPEGTTVSYGATWRAQRPSRLATLAVGYGDGLKVALSNRGFALLGGRRVPIVGRVCMDVTLVDVTDAGAVDPGDVATLLGRDGEEEIGLAEMARLSDTIEYEILTGFTSRLPRVEIRSSTRASSEAAGSSPTEAARAGG